MCPFRTRRSRRRNRSGPGRSPVRVIRRPPEWAGWAAGQHRRHPPQRRLHAVVGIRRPAYECGCIRRAAAPLRRVMRKQVSKERRMLRTPVPPPIVRRTARTGQRLAHRRRQQAIGRHHRPIPAGFQVKDAAVRPMHAAICPMHAASRFGRMYCGSHDGNIRSLYGRRARCIRPPVSCRIHRPSRPPGCSRPPSRRGPPGCIRPPPAAAPRVTGGRALPLRRRRPHFLPAPPAGRHPRNVARMPAVGRHNFRTVFKPQMKRHHEPNLTQHKLQPQRHRFRSLRLFPHPVHHCSARGAAGGLPGVLCGQPAGKSAVRYPYEAGHRRLFRRAADACRFPALPLASLAAHAATSRPAGITKPVSIRCAPARSFPRQPGCRMRPAQARSTSSDRRHRNSSGGIQ